MTSQRHLPPANYQPLQSRSKLALIDTHCHIHEADYPLDREEAYQRALEAGVERIICVGTTADSSKDAVAFAATHPAAWASIGLHPHDAAIHGEESVWGEFAKLKNVAAQKPEKLVAVGECGLDYYYHEDVDNRQLQQRLLRAHIELAFELNVPLIFHVRGAKPEKAGAASAFDDFWSVLDDYPPVRGVLHSFTDSIENMQKGVERGLYLGVNGISTFTKLAEQIEMFRLFRHIPLQNILLETDAPFLTPVPNRGNVNEPAYVMCIASHIAGLQSISLEELSRATTSNALKLLF